VIVLPQRRLGSRGFPRMAGLNNFKGCGTRRAFMGQITMIVLSVGSTQTGIRQRSLRKQCLLSRATALVFVLATGATPAIGAAADAQTLA